MNKSTQPCPGKPEDRPVTRRRRGVRRIIVNEVAYTWKYGDWIEIRRGRSVVIRMPVTDVLGVTWDALERAETKGYGYPLTPARIAALIKDRCALGEQARAPRDHAPSPKAARKTA